MFSEHGRPVFIDTLSFERYREGQGWVAYRQFCQHFLAPLALMRFTDVRLSQLFRVFLDGVPLDLATSLLPASTWLRPSLLAHIHLHAMAQRRFAHRPSAAKGRTNVSRTGLVGLVDHLDAAIRRLSWQARSSEWADYYDSANYSEVAAADKERLVRELVSQIQPGVVWDLGANTGRYSRVCAELGALTLAFDADAVAVELHYQACREQKDGAGVLPLVLDFTNPSPAIGWMNRERPALVARSKPDAILALALIHHLAITNNVPLQILAESFAELCRWLIIEFVPKQDSQVIRMLASRTDVFADYDKGNFEAVFADSFEICRSDRIADSERVLYLMRRRDGAATLTPGRA